MSVKIKKFVTGDVLIVQNTTESTPVYFSGLQIKETLGFMFRAGLLVSLEIVKS